MHHKASATTSQEYLIPLFLQALDFFTTKNNSSTKATSPSTDQRSQHSFPLEHCYCTRTLNIRFGNDLIVSILCLCSVEDNANPWNWCHKLKISVLTILPGLRWTKQLALVTLGIVEVTKRFDQLSLLAAIMIKKHFTILISNTRLFLSPSLALSTPPEMRSANTFRYLVVWFWENRDISD